MVSVEYDRCPPPTLTRSCFGNERQLSHAFVKILNNMVFLPSLDLYNLALDSNGHHKNCDILALNHMIMHGDQEYKLYDPGAYNCFVPISRVQY